MADFLGIERLTLGPWQAFERAIQRLLVHAGFSDVQLVGQPGDEGADIVGEYQGKTWVAQAKFRSYGQLIAPTAIDEVTIAADRYVAQVALVATNTGFNEAAVDHAKKRRGDIGIPFYLWNADALLGRARLLPDYALERRDPRLYQGKAIEAINQQIMEGARTGLLLMATGLGKTRVAAGVIEQWVNDHPGNECLVLAPSLALVPQLEASFWPYLPKWVPTHVLTGSEKPVFEGGVTVATEQSMIVRGAENSGRYGLVIVDEAHHAPADGYRRLLEMLEPVYMLGMTATPWRGDERQLAEIFGEPVFTLSIVEGMQMGYLAQVDYRMLIDDIDWGWLQSSLRGLVSMRDLNRHLFVPERDQAVIDKVRDHLAQLDSPRCIIFCRSIEHAEAIFKSLKADGVRVLVAHSSMDHKEAARMLHLFRSKEANVLVTVDMLNEGIDIPDVNLIVFLRVTHSRRIFVQQLGRGLRLAPGKSIVRVLDFVSDIRRVAEALEMNRSAKEWARRADPKEVIRYPTGDIVKFEGDRSLNFFREYLQDVGELGESDQVRLKFP